MFLSIYFNISRGDPKLDVPSYLHYTKNKLIPPLLILPKRGWILYDQRPKKPPKKYLKGGHGYDPYLSDEMQAIFFARGPAFKRGVTMEPFESVNVYPLLAHLLGIKPKPNNGSLSVFKHILKDFPYEEIELPGRYPRVSYAMLFIGIFILLILLMGFAYYCLTHTYRRCCRRKRTNYSRVSKMLINDLDYDDEEEDEF